MALASEKRRLASLTAAIERNRGGLQLSRLSVEQRDCFEEWRNRCATYAASFNEPDAAFAAMIEPDGSEWPKLRSDVHRALFGQFTILVTDTAAQAGEKYRSARENSR